MQKQKRKKKSGLTQAAIARDWGVSREWVNQQVQKGCPQTSLKAAREWRAEFASGPQRSPAERVKAERESEKEAAKVKIPKRRKTEDSLRDALDNAIQVADFAYERLTSYMAQGKAVPMGVFISLHNKALDARFTAEKSYREELERRGILIRKEHAMDIIKRCMEPVLRRLRRVAQEVGPQCNPQDPIVATNILEQEINTVIEIGRKELDAALKS